MKASIRASATLATFATLVLSLQGCGTSATPPGGGFDEDTGGTPGTDSGGTTPDGTSPTPDGATPDDTSSPVDTGPVTDTTPLPADTAVPPGDGGGCAKITSGTQAVHVVMQVTWPGTIGTEAGSGPVHVWTRSKFTIDGSGNITATNSPCGSVIPDIQTTPIAGGGKVQAEFPAALWNAPSMPTFGATGTQSGYDVGSTVTIKASAVILGTTLTAPDGAWPAVGMIKGVDHDGDGKTGITSVPKSGGGYSEPPTSLLRTDFADRLYIASRITTTTMGTRTACDATKGTANIANFDNHVIGCHVKGKSECTQAQWEFIDNNRTVYSVKSATFETKFVPATATCDDVRAALPK